MQKSITKNSTETQTLGENLAKDILEKNSGSHAVVLCLKGDLGAGKTTFLQGFARGLGVVEPILSPTFVVMKRFPMNYPEFKNFYHFDLYRLQNHEEILDLGLKEIITDPRNIVAIEWPEKIQGLLPADTIQISFLHDSENQRSLCIEKNGL
jgi:tRNA threonylcarbamoyladenosine biosynthesis protein TsaE